MFALIPLIMNMLGVNGAVAGALGSMGLGSGVASALAPAITSGLGTWAATGDPSKGLTAGLTGGLTAGLGGMFGGGANAASGAANAASGAADAAKALPKLTDIAANDIPMVGRGGLQASADMFGSPAAAASNVPYQAATEAAPKAAASGGMGGLMPWLVGGAALLPSLLGGGHQDDGNTTPPYQHASITPRHVVGVPSQGTGSNSPSTYLPGDVSQDGTIWRYGQQGGPDGGGEHMWFDVVPNSARPPLDPIASSSNGSGGGSQQARPTITLDMPNAGRFRFASGGLANMMATQMGGRVSGPGTGTSDSIPALVSNNEFIVPADVVTHLGAGSPEAGGRQLSDMMQQVRLAAQKQPQPRSMGLQVHPA